MKNSTLYTIILLITGISIYFIFDAINELSKVQDPSEEDEDPSTSNEDSEEDDPEKTFT